MPINPESLHVPAQVATDRRHALILIVLVVFGEDVFTQDVDLGRPEIAEGKHDGGIAGQNAVVAVVAVSRLIVHHPALDGHEAAKLLGDLRVVVGCLRGCAGEKRKSNAQCQERETFHGRSPAN